jgi:hypothetical protein
VDEDVVDMDGEEEEEMMDNHQEKLNGKQK